MNYQPNQAPPQPVIYSERDPIKNSLHQQQQYYRQNNNQPFNQQYPPQPQYSQNYGGQNGYPPQYSGQYPQQYLQMNPHY